MQKEIHNVRKNRAWDLYVVKKDGRREKFSREKLETGIYRAFEKRPVKEDIEKMINEIEEQLMKHGKKKLEVLLLEKLL